MITLKKIHKIILVVAVVSVLLSSFLISSGASGTSDYVPNWLRVPYLNFTAFVSDDNFVEDKAIVVESNLKFPISPSGTGDFIYSNVLDVNDATSLSYAFINRMKPDADTYGIKGNVGDFSVYCEFNSDVDLSGSNFYIAFDPFSIPIELALKKDEYAYNALGTFTIRRDQPDDDSQYYIRAEGYSLYYEYVYVDKAGQIQTVSKNVSVGLDVFYYSKYFLEELRKDIVSHSSSIDSDVFVSNFRVGAIDCDRLDSYWIGGTSRWIDFHRDDFTNTLESWKSKNVINTPTILESVTIGIDSVMDLELFGLWTLREIFIAVLTVPLCIWLLRLFAGG